MTQPALPALPETLLTRKPKLSGICPSKALLYMFLAAVPCSFVLGIAAHYVGILVGFLAGLLALLPNLLTSLCGGIVCMFVLFAIAIIFFAFVGYPFVVGIVGGEIVGWLGKKGHCRNTTIAGWAGVLNGLFIYAGHALIAWLRYGGFHPLTVTTKMMGDVFSTTITGTPWWMIVLVVVEVIILVIGAATRANGSIEESAYCETHNSWYGNWKQGRFSVETADAFSSALTDMDTRPLESLVRLEEETYPHLLIKTRGCPVSPTCQIEVSGTIHWQETTVNRKGEQKTENKSEVWFDVMMPALFGSTTERLLNLQETLPASKKKTG